MPHFLMLLLQASGAGDRCLSRRQQREPGPSSLPLARTRRSSLTRCRRGGSCGHTHVVRCRRYLTQSQFQTGIHSTSLFLTASAQNLLCLNMAAELGAVVPDQFMNWFLGAAAPTIVGERAAPSPAARRAGPRCLRERARSAGLAQRSAAGGLHAERPCRRPAAPPPPAH